VFRCNPDGTDLEIFATGLRNPQELAFDQYGNLWTGDNDGDGGDKARWVYLVEGGDSGWTLGWQWLPKMGAWNSERLWHLPPNNTAAYIIPPIAHIGHGPAGIAFYPGTGMPDRYRNHFFVSDFPGGIRTFTVEPQGASFTVHNPENYLQNNSAGNMRGKLLWGLFPVDVDFGPDGGVYVADWVQGWEKTGKGRIFRVYDPEVVKSPLVLETKKLLGEDLEKFSLRKLAPLLGHPDQRVRQEAQFALAAKGPDALKTFSQATTKNNQQLARLHAIWGLGLILSRPNLPNAPRHTGLNALLPLLADTDPEVRAQAAKVSGELRFPQALPALIASLKDPNLRVRFFAAMSLGKLGSDQAILPLIEMLRQNAGQDAYLQHAGVMALVWLEDLDALIAAAYDPSPHVRLSVLLALRRLHRPEVSHFLQDPHLDLVLESARAIYDLNIEPALPQLAALLNENTRLQNLTLLPRAAAPPQPDHLANEFREFILRRVIQANYRLGRTEHALALTQFATTDNLSPSLRAEALEALAAWAEPPGRDRIVGLWRPLPPREVRAARIPLRSEISSILTNSPALVQEAAAQTAASLSLDSANHALLELVSNPQSAAPVRIAALEALAELKPRQLDAAVETLTADLDENLRRAATRLLAQLRPEDALVQLAAQLETGATPDRQSALQALAAIQGRRSDTLLSRTLALLIEGRLPKELHLDLLEAAASRTSTEIQQKLELYQASQEADHPLVGFQETLFGGSAEAGRKIFFEQAEAACLRCHKIDGLGGEVGPDLTGIGTLQNRESILESILYPNRQITPGYENLTITLQNGTVYSGLVQKEDAAVLVLNSPEDGVILLNKSKIQSRQTGLSSMPDEMDKILSKHELRDLVEFLASQK
jgi:quinoprotein glucose dehydrogenase